MNEKKLAWMALSLKSIDGMRGLGTQSSEVRDATYRSMAVLTVC